MGVKYAKSVSIIFIILGLLVIGLGVVLLMETGRTQIGMFTGVFIALVGVLSLINPLVVLKDNEVQMRNLFGMTLKRYPISAVRVEMGKNDVPILIAPKSNGGKRTLLKGKSLFFDNEASLTLIHAVQGGTFD